MAAFLAELGRQMAPLFEEQLTVPADVDPTLAWAVALALSVDDPLRRACLGRGLSGLTAAVRRMDEDALRVAVTAPSSRDVAAVIVGRPQRPGPATRPKRT